MASDRLRVLCANVDTLTNKMDEFSVRVFSENPHVICLGVTEEHIRGD